jgi:hypothetical protein
MAKYYCHENFRSGITCDYRTSDGMCNGGWFYACEHKSTTPKFRLPTTAPKPVKRRSSDCSLCEHKTICSLKKSFNKLKSENYPIVCECQYYKSCNPLFDI